MAIPAFVAAETSVEGQGGLGLTIGIPSGAPAGSRLLLVTSHQCTTPGVPTVSTGWTVVQQTTTPTTSGGSTTVWTAEATSGGDTDPGSEVTITFPANSKSSAAIVAYEASAVLDSAIDESEDGSWGTSVATPTAEALGDAAVVHIYGTIMNTNDASSTPVSWTPHASTTERADIGSVGTVAGSGRQATVMIADEDLAGGGTSTSRAATASVNVRARPAVVLLGSTVDQPTADAGIDQAVSAGATVNLSGTASGGAGGPYTYKWSQVSGPTVSLNDDTAQNPSFTAPGSTSVVVLQLVVEDVDGVPSPADTVTIAVSGAEDVSVPVSDIATAGWATQPGSASSLAEVLADNTDATYAISPADPDGDGFRVHMSELTDGSSSDTVILAFRARLADGATSGTITGQLVEDGSTVIATLLDQPINGTNWQQFILNLTPAEIESVTDWGDVDFAVSVTAVS